MAARAILGEGEGEEGDVVVIQSALTLSLWCVAIEQGMMYEGEEEDATPFEVLVLRKQR